MDGLQKVTTDFGVTPVKDRLATDWRLDALISYRALNGLITDDDGLHKLSVDDFATELGVTRKTLYEWQKQIPEFWVKVNERRREIAPNARLAKVHDVMYMSALKPGADGYRDRVLYLANFDDTFRMPTQPVEHSVANSWAALMQQKSKSVENIQEGEIVDGEAKAV